eukprot:gnl/Hemi2/22459_TR7481_c0_g1_i1.p1 gnl/Hemi2/22459_TR7481_c0_g1~~gnl/Hemi2/22459_TR7481_c0_g1_i1.p1  ORF type:complete len:382 (-),score=80.06 gnl/Hemi2/22459_TR7481_c0_g1_i1:43-1188(-)
MRLAQAARPAPHAAFSKEATPGPGAYNPNLLATAPRVAAAQINRAHGCDRAWAANAAADLGAPDLLDTGPGPGSYNAPVVRSVTSLGGVIPADDPEDKRKRKVLEPPGPGHYTVRPPQPRGTKFSTASADPAARDMNPGPGAYMPQSDSKTRSPQRAPQFARSPRMPKLADISPGPGSYLRADASVHASGFGFARTNAVRLSASTDGPGPGAYDVAQSAAAIRLKRMPAYSMATSKRAERGDFDTNPGPGTYHKLEKILDKKDSSYFLPGRGASSFVPTSITPGPGSYNPTSHRTRASIRFPTAPRDRVAMEPKGGRDSVLSDWSRKSPSPPPHHAPSGPSWGTPVFAGAAPASLVTVTERGRAAPRLPTTLPRRSQSVNR